MNHSKFLALFAPVFLIACVENTEGLFGEGSGGSGGDDWTPRARTETTGGNDQTSTGSSASNTSGSGDSSTVGSTSTGSNVGCEFKNCTEIGDLIREELSQPNPFAPHACDYADSTWYESHNVCPINCGETCGPLEECGAPTMLGVDNEIEGHPGLCGGNCMDFASNGGCPQGEKMVVCDNNLDESNPPHSGCEKVDSQLWCCFN